MAIGSGALSRSVTRGPLSHRSTPTLTPPAATGAAQHRQRADLVVPWELVCPSHCPLLA